MLIVTAGMGGGHNHIAAEMRRRLGKTQHEVLVVDLLEVMPRPTGAALQAIYRFLVGGAPSLYEWVYTTFFRARQRAGERVAVPVRLALPGLRKLVAAFAPDVVVTTYHLAALAVGQLRAEGVLEAPAITFITQFAVHDLWLHPSADLELTISEPAAEEVRRRSGREAVVVGPVVGPDFHEQAGSGLSAALRQRWGLGPADRAALVVTGSLGFAGAAERAVTALARLGWRPVVVAGRNEALRMRFDRRGDAVTFGWVDDMRTLMGACDVVIDNACGTTAKEALRLGLPVVTFRPIAGHGRDDARAMAALGLTELVDDEPALEAALARLDDPRTRAKRVDRGKELFVGDAAALVSEVARGRGAPWRRG